MAPAFLLAGTTSSGLPLLLTVGLAITFGGASIGLYGLNYFAKPIEAKLLRRITGAAAPQTA